jgi:hypothetical protein
LRVAIAAGRLNVVNGIAVVPHQISACRADRVAVKTSQIIGVGALTVRDETNGGFLSAVSAFYGTAGRDRFHFLLTSLMVFCGDSITGWNWDPLDAKKIFAFEKNILTLPPGLANIVIPDAFGKRRELGNGSFRLAGRLIVKSALKVAIRSYDLREHS